MIATLRYEFLMQVRRPVMWIVYALTVAVLLATGPGFSTLSLGGSDARDAKTAMVLLAPIMMTLMPIVYGCMLADRLVRDRRLGVDAVLDTTPADRTGRLVGKYLGACAATAVPFLAAYFARALVYVVAEGRPSALGWAVAVFVTTVVPGLLFTGALALAGPLLMPPMLFRVLFVVYWFCFVVIPPSVLPSPSYSIISPEGDYMRYGLYREGLAEGEVYRPSTAYAALDETGYFNFLRPDATPATALLWAALMLALALALLALVRLHAARTES
ncbi:hypothetical protein GCM10010517_31870 [Streptosporangium fragile]|uniref:ABC transporter permease n=1 Tax=Streptosporangium fragile TaxID=46186 RepID=A0ABP6ID53_9ACTN